MLISFEIKGAAGRIFGVELKLEYADARRFQAIIFRCVYAVLSVQVTDTVHYGLRMHACSKRDA